LAVVPARKALLERPLLCFLSARHETRSR
jgi:hypothetical protein